MTGFRVSDHRAWRDVGVNEPKGGVVQDDRGPAAVEDTPDDLPHRLLAMPAQVHNRLFSRLERRRPLFLVTRFALVLLAVILILQGVTGAAQPAAQVGDYERVTEPSAVQAYLAPGSTHKYPIDVAVGEGRGVSAFFTQDRAVIRLPSMNGGGTTYGLQIGVVHDQQLMDVALMVAQPNEGFRSVPVTSKSGTATQFQPIAFDTAGEYGVLVRSTDGVGPARIMVSVVEAPVESTAPIVFAWLPLLAGTALATVLVGPYLPGAAKARGAARRRDRPPLPEAALALGFAHLCPTRHGLLVEQGRGASAETLAAHHNRGWVIRVE